MKKTVLRVVGMLIIVTHRVGYPQDHITHEDTCKRRAAVQVITGTVLGMKSLARMNDYWQSWKDLARKTESACQHCRLLQQKESSEWQALRNMCGEGGTHVREKGLQQAAIGRRTWYQKQTTIAAHLLRTRGTLWAGVFGGSCYAVYDALTYFVKKSIGSSF